MPLIWEWTVPESSAERADRAIAKGIASQTDLPHDALTLQKSETYLLLSRSRIQQLMDEQKITVGGAPITASARLRPGDKVRIELPDPRPLDLIPENIPLEFLYEDEHLLVVNKPAGLTVHPSETQTTGTLVHALLYCVRDLSGIGGVQRPGIVHRLDKNTSGALIVTKTDAAHAKLAQDFSVHAIERRYWAFCYRDLIILTKDEELRIEGTIGRSPSDRKKMAMNVSDGKNAITFVHKLEAYGTSNARPFACWVEARLETGRTHQVRVHLAASGNSLLGDPTYGATGTNQPKWKALPSSVQEAVAALPGQALHARVIGFTHPITGQSIRIEAEPPEAFRLLQSRLQEYR